MNSIVDSLETGPLLGGLDKPKFSIRTIKGLIREALDELAESPLDGEDFNLVVDAFARRGLLYINAGLRSEQPGGSKR